tara:strand:+ start:1396 stop:1815 length:420 start_codon:yes stop_codon:yes gene_type:complete
MYTRQKKDLMKILRDPTYKPRAKHNMTLGSFIKALWTKRGGLYVTTSHDLPIGRPHSYCGYPSDVAFEHISTPITVIELSELAQDYIDRVVNTYVAKVNSPLWVSYSDEISRLAIVDVVAKDGGIVIMLEEVAQEVEIL